MATELLYPQSVFKNFELISSVPRGSGNEKELSNLIKNFATSIGLETSQDEKFNLIVKKPATNGSSKTVMLQSHIDMVVEADDGINHDFKKDPIDISLEDGILSANGTTLGADNGIGVAYMMAIMESSDLPHPNLEFVFTTQEEVGLIGVHALDLSDSKATAVINLDSEEEDYILAGCAGAVNANLYLRKEYKPAAPRNSALEIRVRGLSGGHSGMDIDKQKGNANIVMGRILNSITYNFDLFGVNGGSKRNVIPRLAEASISINPNDLEAVVRQIQKTAAKIQKEVYNVDPGLRIDLRKTAPFAFKVFTSDCKNKIIKLMNLIPNGVISMNTDLNIVDTSLNFAVVRESNTKIEFVSLIRSASQSKKDYMKSKMAMLAETFNCAIEFSAEYPAWEYNNRSSFEDIAVEVYKNKFEKEPIVAVMHCGLECGILLNKLPHKAEAISIGPNIFHVHSPREYAEVDSIGKVWDYLLALLSEL